MMNAGKDKKDKIIRIILIIIIILLLIHNCNLIRKKNKDKVPSGNVNIIEITCEDDNKCDVTPDENKKDDSNSDDGNQSNSGTTTNNNKNTKQGTTSSDEKKDNQSTTTETDSGTTPSTGGDVGNDDNNDDDDYNDNKVTVFDSDVKWEDTTALKIFTDSVYHLDGKIAPESSNTYQFVVKNSTMFKLNYNISFIETNPYHINMKYKLKKNNTYLVDHYVSYDELNINDQILNSKSNDTFYLEWKWVSSDHDNEAGNVEANYSLKIEVKAESV